MWSLGVGAARSTSTSSSCTSPITTALNLAPVPPQPLDQEQGERPVDYIRGRFWRGYAFSSLEEANRDLQEWLKRVANVRIPATHRQPIRDAGSKKGPIYARFRPWTTTPR